MSIALVTTAG